MSILRLKAGAVAGIACLLLQAPACIAQGYGEKPIRLVIRFSAGASGDATMRTVAGPWSELIGQPVVIENRAGAAGVLAAEAVAKAAPDGSTLLGTTPATQVFRQFLAKDSSFDPVKDFTPITTVVDTGMAIVANPKVPVKTLRGLLEYAKANPGKVSYGTAGIASEMHLAGEQIGQLSGAKLLHVPYKSAAQALLDVVSGEVMFAFAVYSAALTEIKSGRLIPMASEKRLAILPNVPAISEVVPGFEPVPLWSGIFGPGRMQEAVVRRINADVVKVLNRPDVRERLGGIGYQVAPISAPEFASLIQQNIRTVERVIKAAGIAPE
jgi:tripartite-type tricarboxylate transporter receptor subunit TctC